MNNMQKRIATLGGLLVALIVLFPPWVETIVKVNYKTGERSVLTKTLQGRAMIFAAPQMPEPDFNVGDTVSLVVDVKNTFRIDWQMFTMQIVFVVLVAAVLCFATRTYD